MSIFDPIETQRIAEWLEKREALQAAETLLNLKSRDHKAVRPLVVQCVRQLIEFAENAYVNCDLETAAKHSRQAEALLTLSGSDAELAVAIQISLEQSKKRQKADEEDLELGRRLYSDKRLQTAIEQLTPIGHLDEAKRFIKRIETDFKAYERYCDNCNEALEYKEIDQAKQWLQKAKQVNASGSQIPSLESSVKTLSKSLTTCADEAGPYQAISTNDEGFILDGGSPEMNTLILFGHTLVIGSNKDYGTPAAIRIVGANLIHQQHCVIYRHLSSDGLMKYWITPHPSYADNHVTIERPTGKRLQLLSGNHVRMIELVHGDIIHLHGEQNCDAAKAVSMRFYHNRVQEIRTSACLQIDNVDSLNKPIASCFSRNGIRCKRVAMFDKNVSIPIQPLNLSVAEDTAGSIEYLLSNDDKNIFVNARDGILTSSGQFGEILDEGELEILVRINCLVHFRKTFQHKPITIRHLTVNEMN